jgi:hypothetical protein
MRRLFSLITLLIFLIFLTSCQDEKNMPIVDPSDPNIVFEGPQNPQFDGNLPGATVELQYFEPSASPSSPTSLPSLTPASLTATLQQGQSIMESKSLFLPASITPPKADVLVCFDLTGSMGEELNNLKINSVNIMNAVRADIADSWFGVISHMDYVGSYSGCGYSSFYGSGSSLTADYPYRLDSPISSDIPSVQSAINSLLLGFGEDFPENYTRAFYETYADPNISFRAGSKKIVLAFLDALPHDCNVVVGSNTYTFGPDPGRDGIEGTADDLVMNEVLDQMAANNIVQAGEVSENCPLSQGYWRTHPNEWPATVTPISFNHKIKISIKIQNKFGHRIANLLISGSFLKVKCHHSSARFRKPYLSIKTF